MLWGKRGNGMSGRRWAASNSMAAACLYCCQRGARRYGTRWLYQTLKLLVGQFHLLFEKT